MRKVDFDTGYALRDLKEGRIDNKTFIDYADGFYVVRLHGNPIARYNGVVLEIDTCGYYTLTTTNRLNGILYAITGDHIVRRGSAFYFSGIKWDGKPKKIKTNVLKKGDIIRYKNFVYKVINVNKKAEDANFKYELEAINEDINHSFFMSDKELNLITIIKSQGAKDK